jgi:hypothetical protein
MEIKVLSVTEHEDGSATVMMEMDEQCKSYLINHAIIDLLRKGLKEVEELHND